MKLVIQIPCLNEAATLPATLAALPRSVPGIDMIEILVIDDGSIDGTAQVARACGAHHVVRFASNRGLARAFEEGIWESLRLGADVIVNTDGDNQYDAACIADLVAPILRGEALVVIGDRPIEETADFSWVKKRLQRMGSRVVRDLSGTDFPDVTSGFRALSRDAALRLTVLSEYSYTLESLFQFGAERIATTHVPIRTHRVARPSRLAGSMWGYVAESTKTILRVYTHHRPLRVFGTLGAILAGLGLLLAGRYLVLDWVFHEGKGHLHSVVVAALLLNVAIVLWMMGLTADAIRGNRKMLERVLYRQRGMELRWMNGGPNADSRAQRDLPP